MPIEMADRGRRANYKAWITGIIAFAACTTVAGNSGYLVVLPSVFRPDVEEVLSVTILKPTEPIYVEAKLFSTTGHLLTEAGHEIFGKGTVKLKVPSDAEGLCNLKLCGNCNSIREGSYSFYNSSYVKVDQKGTSVFIQTDKPIYKPSQTVNVNVILTKPDLRPANTELTLSLMDPNQSQIIKWTDLPSLCCGMVNVSFPLSHQPVLGTWSVVAHVQGHTYRKEFDIEKYVLPKFEVAIQAPAYIRDWLFCEKVFVHARYTFGQNVKGLVKIEYSVRGIGYYSDHFSPLLTKHSKIYGTAAFNICVSDVISQKYPDHFRGQLHLKAEVTTADGATVTATDESCPVNKQLVDLSFSKDTRTSFKPGLPFKGKIDVQFPDGSVADNVTVLVEAQVDGIEFSKETLVTKDGEAQFYIPPLPSVAQSMILNAKVVRIRDGLVPAYYFSAYQTMTSWYSPSRCHLLIDSRSSTYKVGEEGKFMIHSTCPCNLDMYYEVKARGNLVHSGIHFARHERKHNPTSHKETKFPIYLQQQNNETQGVKTCTVFIKFLITHEMAPFSRLIVYYVRPSGEGVADAIMYNVEPDFRNHMSIDFSNKEAMPGEDIKVHVRTRPGSCVCMAAVDKSVHLLRPGYLLSEREIFKELETYDVTVERDSSPQYHVTGSRDRRRIIRSSWLPLHQGMPVRDAQYAFEECGLLVMTDTVNLQFKQTEHVQETGPSYAYQLSQLMKSQMELIRKKRMRVYFPETWIWKCFNTSTTRKDNPSIVNVPDSITTWIFSGVSMSPKHGLSVAPTNSLQSFQYFFLDFSLPHSVVREEKIKIPLVVHNYLHACIRVHLALHIPNTLEIDSEKEILKKFCIGTEESKTVFYDMIFKQLGTQKISASAEAYADSRCCSGILTDENPDKQFLTGVDAVKQQVRVDPSGLPRYYTHSVYFCPNSRIQLTTPNRYEFQYIARPPEMMAFSFLVKAKNDVRIALSPGPKDNDELIEIVIGGEFNKQSWVTVAGTGEIAANTTTMDVLSDEEYRPFWISWRDKQIEVGYGVNISDNGTTLMLHTLNKTVPVEYIGFSTGWGSEGEFHIWKKTEMGGSGYGEVMHLGVPKNTVPGSAFARATVTGDLMGPSIHHLDKLLRLPQGCGEQNMANFAPNVYILEYLNRTGQLKPDLKLKAVKLLTKGYQRQLTYKRRDGSYSAFGLRDATGNTWLSAFVMKTYAQARRHIFIDEDELARIKGWLTDRQKMDGSFESVGRLIKKEIQGGLSGRMALTAYILTAMWHVGIHSKMDRTVVLMAQSYLEKNVHLIEDPYTAALSAYALSLMGSDRSYSVLKKLSQMAIKENDMVYWKFENHYMQEFLLFNEASFRSKVSSAEVEIAGYAALAYLTKDDLSSAFPIIKWLTAQRNSFGGFSSTQDTVVALHALSHYAIQSYSDVLNMTVSLASTNMDLQERFELGPSNSDVIQTAEVPSLPAGLFLSATGDGCAMFQVEVQYNVPDPTDRPAFDLWYRLGHHQRVTGLPVTGRVRRSDVRITLETCTKWLHAGSSNMAVIEISTLTGYQPDVESLDRLIDDKSTKLKRYDLEGRTIVLYFDEINSRCLTCVSLEMIRKYKVEGAQPVPIRVYDYYEPSYEAEVLYNATNTLQFPSQSNESAELCHPIFGCNIAFPNTKDIRCSCHQQCNNSDAPVCASDGNMYSTECHMEMEACITDQYLESLPKQSCEDSLSGESSGELLEPYHEEQMLSVARSVNSTDVNNTVTTTETLYSNKTSVVSHTEPTLIHYTTAFDNETNAPDEQEMVSPREFFSPGFILNDSTQAIQEPNDHVDTTNTANMSNIQDIGNVSVGYNKTVTIEYTHGDSSPTSNDKISPTTNQMIRSDSKLTTVDFISHSLETQQDPAVNPTMEEMTTAHQDVDQTTQAYKSSKKLIRLEPKPNENALKYRVPPAIQMLSNTDGHKEKQAMSYDKNDASGKYNKVMKVIFNDSHEEKGESNRYPSSKDKFLKTHPDIQVDDEYSVVGKDSTTEDTPNEHDIFTNVDPIERDRTENVDVWEAFPGGFDYGDPKVLDSELLKEDYDKSLGQVKAEDLTDKQFMDMIASYYDFTSLDIPEKSSSPFDADGQLEEAEQDMGLANLVTNSNNLSSGRNVDLSETDTSRAENVLMHIQRVLSQKEQNKHNEHHSPRSNTTEYDNHTNSRKNVTQNRTIQKPKNTSKSPVAPSSFASEPELDTGQTITSSDQSDTNSVQHTTEEHYTITFTQTIFSHTEETDQTSTTEQPMPNPPT